MENDDYDEVDEVFTTELDNDHKLYAVEVSLIPTKLLENVEYYKHS